MKLFNDVPEARAYGCGACPMAVRANRTWCGRWGRGSGVMIGKSKVKSDHIRPQLTNIVACSRDYSPFRRNCVKMTYLPTVTCSSRFWYLDDCLRFDAFIPIYTYIVQIWVKVLWLEHEWHERDSKLEVLRLLSRIAQRIRTSCAYFGANKNKIISKLRQMWLVETLISDKFNSFVLQFRTSNELVELYGDENSSAPQLVWANCKSESVQRGCPGRKKQEIKLC